MVGVSKKIYHHGGHGHTYILRSIYRSSWNVDLFGETGVTLHEALNEALNKNMQLCMMAIACYTKSFLRSEDWSCLEMII